MPVQRSASPCSSSEAGPSSHGPVQRVGRSRARKSPISSSTSHSSPSSCSSPSPSPPPKWRRKKAHRSRSAGRGQIDKIWKAVSSQQAIFAELLKECSAPPSVPVVLLIAPFAPLQTVTDELDDMLSVAASEEVNDQLVLPSDNAESDMPVAQLSLSAKLMPLMQWATAVLQVPWPAAQTERHSIYDEQPIVTVYLGTPGHGHGGFPFNGLTVQGF
ncbi:UNVERIFIED_CONTAM: hypothetical protein FKN15_045128 [Acipenser sinensis]